MPNWVGSPLLERVVTINLLGFGGDRASIRLDGLSQTVSDGQVTGLRGAIANLTNAVPISTFNSFVSQVLPASQTVFDEAYSSVATKMVLQFQDASLNVRRMGIPAPDAQFFGSDGVTVITPDAGGSAAQVALAASIAVFLAIINTGGGTYVYAGGYKAATSRPTRRPRTQPLIDEPGSGDAPSDAPGLLPAP